MSGLYHKHDYPASNKSYAASCPSPAWGTGRFLYHENCYPARPTTPFTNASGYRGSCGCCGWNGPLSH